MDTMKDVWIVTADTCPGYGAELYLIGIYDNEKLAKEIAEDFEKNTDHVFIDILKTQTNKIHKLSISSAHHSNYDHDSNENTIYNNAIWSANNEDEGVLYLGGYTE